MIGCVHARPAPLRHSVLIDSTWPTAYTLLVPPAAAVAGRYRTRGHVDPVRVSRTRSQWTAEPRWVPEHDLLRSAPDRHPDVRRVRVVASFALSVTFLPALLSLLPLRASASGRGDDPMMAAIADFVVRRRTVLLWGSAAVVLALLAAVPRNELNDVLVHFFDESVEFRRDTDFLDERLSGNTVLEYSSFARPGRNRQSRLLADMSAVADGTVPAETAPRRSTDLRHSTRASADDPGAYRLPPAAARSQYLRSDELSPALTLDLNTEHVSRSATCRR